MEGKTKRLLVCFLFIIFIFSIYQVSGATRKEIQIDLEGDGYFETLYFEPANSTALTIWRNNEKIWEGVPQRWKPWKLEVADLDGDGIYEIILGVFKKTRFFPKPHNCLFVLGWDGKEGFPKWLGSRLSKPFTDFTFYELDDKKGAELISLEVTHTGKRCIVVYTWCGFGFVGIWQSENFPEGKLLKDEKGRVIIILSGGKRAVLNKKGETYYMEKE